MESHSLCSEISNDDRFREYSFLKKSGFQAGCILLCAAFLPRILKPALSALGFSYILKSISFFFLGEEGIRLFPLIQSIFLYLAGTIPAATLSLSLLRTSRVEKAPDGDTHVARLGMMALAAGAVVITFTDFLSQNLWRIGILEMESAPPMSSGSILSVVLYLIRIVLLPAALESFIFRKGLLTALRRYGDSFAIAASALLSLVMADNLTNALQYLLLGLILSYLTVKLNSAYLSFTVYASILALPILTDLLDILFKDYGKAVSSLLLMLLILLGFLSLFLALKEEGSLFSLSDKNDRMFRASYKAKIFFQNFPLTAAVLLWIILLPECYQFL